MPEKTEDQDVAMTDVPAEGYEQQDEQELTSILDPEKIVILPGAAEDGTAASFQIKKEDHTLGNALRYIIMKNPDVEFCGYSIPHPSEEKMNIRIQTYGETSAVDALRKGLQDLVDLCDHVEKTFIQEIENTVKAQA